MNSVAVLKKLAIHEVVVDAFSHEARGIATLQGQRIFIHGALIGERVKIKLLGRQKKIWQAELVEILQASPDRRQPACAFAEICGGCNLQHMNLETQIQFKESTLLNHMKHFGGQSIEALIPPLLAEPLGYRKKARLGVRYVQKKDKVLVGFREKSSNYLADMTSCKTLDPIIGLMIEALQALILGLEGKRTIPQIEVAIGDDAVALIFRHLEPLVDSDEKALIHFCKTQNFQCFLQSKGPESVHRVFPESTGNDRLFFEHPRFDLKMAFHPTDFIQVNSAINQKMVSRAIDWLDLQADDRVLDLFCGLGNFTLPLARTAKEAIGIELSETMVERGYENAQRNQMTNLRFFAADLMTEEGLQAIPWDNLPNKILIDPPRSGAELVVKHLAKLPIERLVYVSCNSASLARDTALLVAGGMKCVQVGMMDMFPQTHHMEAMALFVRS